MSKKSPVLHKPIAETYQYLHRGEVQEVAVSVHINYREGTISLVDQAPDNNLPALKGKQWLFAKREIEYMAGWHDILDAMKAAITDATARLEKYQKQVEKEKVEFAAKLSREA